MYRIDINNRDRPNIIMNTKLWLRTDLIFLGHVVPKRIGMPIIIKLLFTFT